MQRLRWMADFPWTKLKSFCNICNRPQNQHVLASHTHGFENDEEGWYADATFQVVRCGGCDNFSFREIYTNADDRDEETGDCVPHVKCLPEPTHDLRVMKPFRNVPLSIRTVYQEVINGYNQRTLLLCAAGVRAIIEGICKAENIVDGPVQGAPNMRRTDLKAKIEGMFEKGLISNEYREVLHDHRVFGNEALHEVDTPDLEEVNLAIDIVEHSLEHLYEIRKKAEAFRNLKKTRKPNSTPPPSTTTPGASTTPAASANPTSSPAPTVPVASGPQNQQKVGA